MTTEGSGTVTGSNFSSHPSVAQVVSLRYHDGWALKNVALTEFAFLESL